MLFLFFINNRGVSGRIQTQPVDFDGPTGEFRDVHAWRSLQIFTKNACISSSEKLVVLLAELKDLVWDVVLFSEARALDCAVLLGDGHKLFINSGGNIHAGVGILVEKKLVRRIRQVKDVNDRIMLIDLKFERMMIRFVAVYCPHADYDIDELENVYLELEKIMVEAEH